jgi:hypothetical protein
MVLVSEENVKWLKNLNCDVLYFARMETDFVQCSYQFVSPLLSSAKLLELEELMY